MPFAPFPPAPRRALPPAPALRRDRPDLASAEPGPLVRAAVRLAPEGDLAATQAWLAHVEAGRIGVPAPPPDRAASDFGLASLAAILGPRHVGIW